MEIRYVRYASIELGVFALDAQASAVSAHAAHPLVITQSLLAHYRRLSQYAKQLEDQRGQLQRDLLELLDGGVTVEPGPLSLNLRVKDPELLLTAVGEVVANHFKKHF